MTTAFAEDLLSRIAASVSLMTEQIDRLHAEGYSDNFIAIGNKLMSKTTFRHYHREELMVDKVSAWEREADIHGVYIYALTHPQDNIKGIYTVIL